MYTPRETGPFAGLKLIDADTHLTEAVDLWTSRAPANRSEEKLGGLEPEVIRKIMQDNAARLYKIEV